MSKSDTPTPPSLADLRAEIDRIDQGMHQLLIARGEIIDTLIKVKKTQESGSAFRPAREASMMRRLVERHHGILPLDTVESIWRVIIATFTHVQAPYAVHADMSAGDAAMRDSVRFHFGFTVPFRTHLGAAGVLQAVAASKGDLGLVPASGVAGRQVGMHREWRLHVGEGRDDDAPDALGGIQRQDAVMALHQPPHHVGLAGGPEG